MQLRFERALLPGGIARDVEIEIDGDGLITRVEAGVGRARGALHAGLAVPGMPNLHSHAFQRAMAGSAEVAAGADGSFWGWRDVMYRFVGRLTPEDVAAISAFAYLEMLEAGYTAVAEFHYVHHDAAGARYPDVATLAEAVRQAARRVGLRHLLLPCLYQTGNFGGQPLSASDQSALKASQASINVAYAVRDLKVSRNGAGLPVVSGRLIKSDKTPPPLVGLLTYQLTGTITDSDGKPVEGAQVSTRTLDRDYWTVSTVSDAVAA